MARISNREAFERAQKIRKEHKEHNTSVRQLSLKFGVGSTFVKEILENKRNPVLPFPEGKYKIHPDYPDYLVYEDGQIYSVFRNAFLSQTENHNGYLMVTLYSGDVRHTRAVHRLLCRTYHGEPESEDLQARHLDGDNQNNHKDNVAWSTILVNIGDRDRHGTEVRGTDVHSAKLDDKIVKRMRKRYSKSGLSKSEFAKQNAHKYGISLSNFIKMLSGKTWKHVSTKHCVKSSIGCKSKMEQLPAEKLKLIKQRRVEHASMPRKKFARLVAEKLVAQGFNIGESSVYKYLKDLGM